MTLRAEPGQNPVLSVSTDAMLRAIDTSFLVDGDYLWSSQSGGYIYLQNSTTALSSTVFAAANSQGGTLPGRLIFNGFGPSGPVPPTPVPPLTYTVTNYAALDTLDANALGAGQLLVVTNQDSQWILKTGDATSIAATSDPNMIRTANTTIPNTKYWERLPIGSASWWQERFNAEGTVFVDSDVGADDAVGSSTDPIQSVDEMNRRVQGIPIDQFIEIAVTGASLILKYPFTPTLSDNNGAGFLLFTGTMTTIGSGAVTATSFNRTTGQSQEYVATVAGQPLTSYVTDPASGLYYLLSDSATPGAPGAIEGWISKTDTVNAGRVFCPTFQNSSDRVSITSTTTVYVHQIATVCPDEMQFPNCPIGVEWHYIGANAVSATNAEHVSFQNCGIGVFGVFVGYSSFAFKCYVHRFVVFNTDLVVTACSVGLNLWPSQNTNTTISSVTCFIQTNAAIPSVFWNNGFHTVGDLELAGGAGNPNLPACQIAGSATVALSDLGSGPWLWGAGNNGATTDIGVLVQNAGSFLTFPDKTKITLAAATAVVRLVSASGTTTNAATNAALPIRNSNSFLGAVD